MESREHFLNRLATNWPKLTGAQQMTIYAITTQIAGGENATLYAEVVRWLDIDNNPSLKTLHRIVQLLVGMTSDQYVRAEMLASPILRFKHYSPLATCEILSHPPPVPTCLIPVVSDDPDPRNLTDAWEDDHQESEVTGRKRPGPEPTSDHRSTGTGFDYFQVFGYEGGVREDEDELYPDTTRPVKKSREEDNNSEDNNSDPHEDEVADQDDDQNGDDHDDDDQDETSFSRVKRDFEVMAAGDSQDDLESSSQPMAKLVRRINGESNRKPSPSTTTTNLTSTQSAPLGVLVADLCEPSTGEQLGCYSEHLRSSRSRRHRDHDNGDDNQGAGAAGANSRL